MAHITSALVLLSLFSVGFGQLPYNYITTDNGATRGTWGVGERCPNGYKVNGISLKVESPQGNGDDSAINAIRLQCVNKINLTATVKSAESPWGYWSDVFKCSYGCIEAYQLKVEAYQGVGDDTTANNLKIQCNNGETFEADGSPWGSYGSWSKVCEYCVCGIRSRVESPQDKGDDTALNDLRMYCCDE